MIFKKTVDRKTKSIRELKETVRAKDNEISELNLKLQKMEEDSKKINKSEREKIAEPVEKRNLCSRLRNFCSKLAKPKNQPESPAQNIIMEDFTNSVSSLDSSFFDFVEWREFEFFTKKTGAEGPSKAECIQYYVERLVFTNINSFEL